MCVHTLYNKVLFHNLVQSVNCLETLNKEIEGKTEKKKKKGKKIKAQDGKWEKKDKV